MIFGADFLLLDDIELTIHYGHVELQSSTAGTTPTTLPTPTGERSTPRTLSTILARHQPVFARNTTELLGTDLLFHCIPTGAHFPIYVPQHRYTERERAVIAEQVK